MKLDSAIQLNPALLGKQAPSIDMARIDETAREFEAMFMTEMLRPMFEGLQVNETFGGGKGEEIFSGMLLDEYGKSMAAQGSLGIADLVREQLIEMQSKASQPKVAQNMHNPLEGQSAPTGEKSDV
jgi:Rod binding domain-containing protein